MSVTVRCPGCGVPIRPAPKVGRQFGHDTEFLWMGMKLRVRHLLWRASLFTPTRYRVAELGVTILDPDPQGYFDPDPQGYLVAPKYLLVGLIEPAGLDQWWQLVAELTAISAPPSWAREMVRQHTLAMPASSTLQQLQEMYRNALPADSARKRLAQIDRHRDTKFRTSPARLPHRGGGARNDSA